MIFEKLVATMHRSVWTALPAIFGMTLLLYALRLDWLTQPAPRIHRAIPLDNGVVARRAIRRFDRFDSDQALSAAFLVRRRDRVLELSAAPRVFDVLRGSIAADPVRKGHEVNVDRLLYPADLKKDCRYASNL